MMNKEDDQVVDNGDVDAVIRVELTNELSPSDIQDICDTNTNSYCVNNAEPHAR